MVGIVISAIPHFWVGFWTVVAIALVAARPVARSLQGPTPVSFLFLTAVGGVLVLTLMPTAGYGDFSANSRCATFEVVPDFVAQLGSVTVESLNLALFVPVSFLAIFVSRRRAVQATLIAAIVVSAPLIEAVQGLFPQLRGGCFELTTVLANELGVVLGLGAAVALAGTRKAVVRNSRRDVT